MRTRFARLASLVALVLTPACDPAPIVRGACTTAADCAPHETCVDERCMPRSMAPDGGGLDGGERPDAGPDHGEVTGIEIVPGAPILVTTNGASATIDLDVVARFEDGETTPLTTAFWSTGSALLGAIDAGTGVFTANGALAGTVEIEVEALGRTATTTLTVRVEHQILVSGAPTDAADRFAAATAVSDIDREANVLYPLEGTVFPQNVFPAELQWERGAAGDLYRVVAQGEGVSVTAYTSHPGDGFRYAWLVDRPAWRALAESAPERPVTLTVDRLEAATGQVITGTARTFRFADAVIRGAIYYWDLGGGRIQRIRGDGTGREAFMPSPPQRPGDGRRCVACHTVSRDGTRMAAELWDGGDFSTVFDLTADLSVDPAPTVFPPDQVRFLFSSFSPDNRRLVANQGNGLFLVDAELGSGTIGTRLEPASSTLPQTGAAHPTWSPDGTAIAFVTGTNGTWAVDFTAGDLAIIDVAWPGDTFAAPRTILPGGGLAVAHPSWSPSSAYIAFQHGQHSRAFQDMGGGVSVRRDARVRLSSRDGAAVWDLEALNGGALNSYYPTFSPFDEGGYFWLAFFSTRDYGNAQAGTRGTGRRQLWVSAISSSPAPGTDPSHAAYWLPQQDVTQQNMAAFWAEEACRADGRTCATSGECCSGFCRDTGGGPICVPPDEVPCSMSGEACRDDGDCCEGAGSCIANTCSTLG